MDLYVKQLSSEIKNKSNQITNKLDSLKQSIQKMFANCLEHVTAFEKYYTLIKDADDKKVSSGSLPFSVYSRPEPVENDNGDESEHIENVLDDKKKVFERNLQALKTESISIEQATSEFVDMIKDLQDYYEDLIEGVKF